MSAAIPLIDLKTQYAGLREELAQAAQRVMDSGVFILGPEGRAFEAEFAAAQGVPHCAGVASGTQGLQLALEALGVGPGDEVAVPAFTFIATATAAAALGAKPVFVDVGPDTLTLDPADLERRLTPKVKAVVPVHLYGQPADMDPILAVAKRRKLRVVEDCAQSHLTRYRGKPVGALGDIGVFSFYPSKNLGALGDAGLLSTADAKLHDECVALRNVGRRPGQQYLHARLGHNGRLDELQAAFLRVKLKRLEAWTEGRRKIAAFYRKGLAGLPLGLPPAEAPGDRQVYHLFVVRTPRRDELAAHLTKAGVGNGVYYPTPLHLQPPFQHIGHKEGDFPASERACREVLALPMYPELSEERAGAVVSAVKSFFH
ncbi:MAG TPA: DegT/DnrJ/EryC1/StrS family aminotransferase [Elusimicrobiota bacterium]|nr:DegT/DnrJ/EryC1/StrS family aminotransferase [Elusimicrobiota bacterium]